ncbi:hypothetical protein CsSME_00037619 [Camellia sinensis var. sinensis]
MASGSSGRNNSASKGFDFATTDDIVCSNPKNNAVVQRKDSVGQRTLLTLTLVVQCKFSFLPRLAKFPQPKMGKSPI